MGRKPPDAPHRGSSSTQHHPRKEIKVRGCGQERTSEPIGDQGREDYLQGLAATTLQTPISPIWGCPNPLLVEPLQQEVRFKRR